MMETYLKPLPTPSATSAPFWQAAHKGKLKIQYCSHCNSYQHYPRAICANCWHDDIEWKRCSGKGTVYSFSICYAAGLPSFKGETPYVVAMVELEEGVMMTTNIINCKPSDVTIDMPVEAVFEQVTEDCTLIKFSPSKH